jgi:predicted nuclease with TOPRIM domain
MAVSAHPLEIRLARLEGAYEQIADRLNGIDHRLESLEKKIDQKMDTRFGELDKKIDANLRTVITWMLGQTAVILGAVAAFAFHR